MKTNGVLITNKGNVEGLENKLLKLGEYSFFLKNSVISAEKFVKWEIKRYAKKLNANVAAVKNEDDFESKKTYSAEVEYYKFKG